MTEQLISLETWEIAKAKGYPVSAKYGNHVITLLLPSQGSLQKWLRDENKVYVIPALLVFNEKNFSSWGYEVNYIHDEIVDIETQLDVQYDTYELALEAGLKHALSLI